MKISRLSTVVVLTCIGLAGCVTAEEQRAQDTGACSGYGFAPGSEGFANCMMQTNMVREQAERDSTAQFMANADADRRERERRDAIKKMNRGYY